MNFSADILRRASVTLALFFSVAWAGSAWAQTRALDPVDNASVEQGPVATSDPDSDEPTPLPWHPGDSGPTPPSEARAR